MGRGGGRGVVIIILWQSYQVLKCVTNRGGLREKPNLNAHKWKNNNKLCKRKQASNGGIIRENLSSVIPLSFITQCIVRILLEQWTVHIYIIVMRPASAFSLWKLRICESEILKVSLVEWLYYISSHWS